MLKTRVMRPSTYKPATIFLSGALFSTAFAITTPITTPLYALFDCNSFYASCVRFFRPDLRHQPIVVLSNNDCCVIARCDQSKQWVKMGTPYHQVRQLLAEKNVQ